MAGVRRTVQQALAKAQDLTIVGTVTPARADGEVVRLELGNALVRGNLVLRQKRTPQRLGVLRALA